MFDLLEADDRPPDDKTPRRAVVAAVHLSGVSDAAFESSLAELGQLAKTLGLEVVGQVIQRRQRIEQAAYLGSGKRKALRAWFESPAPAEKPTDESVGDAAAADEADDEADDEARTEDAGDEPDDDLDSAAEPAAPVGKKAELLLIDHEISDRKSTRLNSSHG